MPKRDIFAEKMKKAAQDYQMQEQEEEALRLGNNACTHSEMVHSDPGAVGAAFAAIYLSGFHCCDRRFRAVFHGDKENASISPLTASNKAERPRREGDDADEPAGRYKLRRRRPSHSTLSSRSFCSL